MALRQVPTWRTAIAATSCLALLAYLALWPHSVHPNLHFQAAKQALLRRPLEREHHFISARHEALQVPLPQTSLIAR
jgi:hypothetical protein